MSEKRLFVFQSQLNMSSMDLNINPIFDILETCVSFQLVNTVCELASRMWYIASESENAY